MQCKKSSLLCTDLIIAAAHFRWTKMGGKVDTKEEGIDGSGIFLEHWLLEFNLTQHLLFLSRASPSLEGDKHAKN